MRHVRSGIVSCPLASPTRFSSRHGAAGAHRCHLPREHARKAVPSQRSEARGQSCLGTVSAEARSDTSMGQTDRDALTEVPLVPLATPHTCCPPHEWRGRGYTQWAEVRSGIKYQAACELVNGSSHSKLLETVWLACHRLCLSMINLTNHSLQPF